MSVPLSERTSLIEIEAGHWQINTVIFTTNGEYLVSGGNEGVCVWRVQDGRKVGDMTVPVVLCLAVSKDGRWIAAGTSLGDVFVWDAETYERVFAQDFDAEDINGVDFSPDSTRLVTASGNWTASVWDIAARQRAGTLNHDDRVIAAKYSPQGDRIATATRGSLRVWDSDDDRLLISISVQVIPFYNTGVLWSNDYLFIISENKIKRIDASTGSAVSEWPVPAANVSSCIAHPQRGKFIAYATQRTVTFWDTSTRTQLGLIQHLKDIYSIAHSPDDRFLAIVAKDRKIIIKRIAHIIDCDSTPLSLLYPTFQEPEVRIDDAALDSWKQDQLEVAEALLTAEIPQSQNTVHHVLASRALVRTRLRQWDAAIVDAEHAIIIQPSVIGYIAHFVALLGSGKTREASRACDMAFELFHSTHVTTLLLIKAVVLFMVGEHDDAISRIDNLIATVQFNSTFFVVQARAYMHLLLGRLHMARDDYEHALQSFEHARAQLGDRTSQPPLVVLLISGWKFDHLGVTIRRYICEALYAGGRAREAVDAILEAAYTVGEVICMNKPIAEWATDFIQRCLCPSGSSSDPSREAGALDDVSIPGASVYLSSTTPLLREWARFKLTVASWKEALAAAAGFIPPRVVIYRVICEHLEMTAHVVDAIACLQEMNSELAQEIEDEQTKWIFDFESRCRGKLEELGDTAMDAGQYDGAISQYSAALSLNASTPQALFVKRSKAHAAKGLWEDALNDANEVIKLDPASPLGYERKHAALRGAGCYDDAIIAFETMLLKISQSSNSDIHDRSRYVTPAQTKEAIRVAIQNTIRESPLVLINTDSGRLVDKSGQMSSFESQPIFAELICSMTARIDHARIEHEVAQYYRYAMLSHKWEDNEPLFEKVVHIVVYDLEESPTHKKLEMFCKIVREAGFSWAWSDTCCINKGDHFVLQEALVSMFKWYQGSAMTIIFLRDVHRVSRRGALMTSIWNTRAWTLQEYHASKVVRFYTEDWTPYMNLGIHNHKESPEIILEMEEATGVSAQALMALRPGLVDIREKLRLASKREATRVEDAAYSLLGIFSTSLPVVYGEGNRALGRLLAQLLTSSGDTTILAWTGRSGSFNSCLPVNTTVFSQLSTSHIPPAIADTEMEIITVGLRSSLLNFTLVTELYDRVNELLVPSFAGQRLRLPCLTFKLGPVSTSSNRTVFRARTTALGVVKIRSEEDLTRLRSLYLIHPWIDYLLDRHPVGTETEIIRDGNVDHLSSVLGGLLPLPDFSDGVFASSQTRTAWLAARPAQPFDGQSRLSTTSAEDTPSLLPPPSSITPMETQMRALRFLARLRQPFGALLLTPTRQHVEEYRRVAAESPITVQVEEITPTILDKLMHSVRMLDVL